MSATTDAAAQSTCPPEPPRALMERFVAEQCTLCWKQAPPVPQREHKDAWFLDWVVPTPEGASTTAPGTTAAHTFLTAAALPEAAARVMRSGLLGADEAFTLSHPLPSSTALALQARHTVSADNGSVELRMAARFTSKRPLPSGLEGWIALVERIPAREEGSQAERQLVRALVGPLSMEGLPKQTVEHARTVPMPRAGRLERWATITWVETVKGRVISVGRGPLDGCR